jgi:hypothetical protein
MFNYCIFCFEGIESYCREMGRKRGGNDCYQPEKWAFLAEGAGNNAMFATTSPPFLSWCLGNWLIAYR